ncbi:polymer-forming cytoskeletal protein [Longimicrobium sp.]|uniref:polymer-forming cytoskeletal protein n=1 Tax=Longimicrobium sp. TaxID=2029185 RepID=UPI002CECFE9C|nr:polymer-forming cytoskeletal protein [Longimicrobium sp.]HSU17295.1 polymer-forming cytoskeletal protein [Longimicrobium sp.]
MRRHALAVLLALIAPPALAVRAAAQETRAQLPPDAARRIVEFYNDPRTVHFAGEWRIAPGSSVAGNVAVLDGNLTVAGRIEGDVVVINGDATLADGGSVTGSLTVVGGAIHRESTAELGGQAIAYAEHLDYLRRGGRIYADIGGAIDAPPPDTAARVAAAEPDTVRDAERPWSEDTAAAGRTERQREHDDWDEGGWSAVRRGRSGQGRADFIVATGQSYNRVEGLPITFGPLLETGGHNPLRLRAMGIFRTEAGPELGPGRWGYEARLEQFIGGRRELRVGGGVFRRIDPIEDWHLSKLENGLSTFFLHRDYRDHFEREGWTAYAMVTPRAFPAQASLGFRSERERSEPAGSPFTLFNNNDPWRAQPLAAQGRLSSLVLNGMIDTRSSAVDPSSGWYVSGEVEQGLGSSLRQPDWQPVNGSDVSPPAPVILPGAEYGAFTSGTIDVRRYNRIGPWSRLNFRVTAGGSMDGSPLPPQRQHALGGEGSLPGFALFSVDCGARRFEVRRADEVARAAGGTRAVPSYFLNYGCDRFALFQAEYRGELSLHLRWNGDDEDAGETESWPRSLRHGLNTDFGWVLFADAGHGWALGDRLVDTRTSVDVGAGVLLGRLGVYGAVPVSTGGSFNLFIRLSPRI